GRVSARARTRALGNTTVVRPSSPCVWGPRPAPRHACRRAGALPRAPPDAPVPCSAQTRRPVVSRAIRLVGRLVALLLVPATLLVTEYLPAEDTALPIGRTAAR